MHMEFLITSKNLISEYFIATDNNGQEHLVVIIKASWKIPEENTRPRPNKPSPFSNTDEYYGEPGLSAMRYGDDHVRFKHNCDVIFDSHAYCPTKESANEFMASVQVGEINKSIKIIGPRKWVNGVINIRKTVAEKIESIPLHYGYAFGGTREYINGGKTNYDANIWNPTGVGWCGENTLSSASETALPNLENPQKPISHPSDKFHPIALSAIGRHWMPRIQYAGTYDDNWRKEKSPFLPDNFSEKFHQVAPVDQQIPYPQGGEEVKFINLIKNKPKLTFYLPPIGNMYVHILRTDLTYENIKANADTIFFETEKSIFSVIWRASTPIKRRIQEFSTIAVGNINKSWWEQKKMGIDILENCINCN